MNNVCGYCGLTKEQRHDGLDPCICQEPNNYVDIPVRFVYKDEMEPKIDSLETSLFLTRNW